MLAFVVLISAVLPAGSPPSPPPVREPTAILQNDTRKTVIRKIVPDNDMTIAVISRSGSSVILDPVYMTATVVPDIIAVTHQDHLSRSYLEAAKGAKVLFKQTGTTTVGAIKITGIAAAQSDVPVNSGAPAMVVYLVETDGLRLAYFGCNGQRRLEPEQLAALGKVDVAMITAEYHNGEFSVIRTRALMQQLAPRVVIPLSHRMGDRDYAFGELAEMANGQLETVDNELALSTTDLEGRALRIIHIEPRGSR